MSSYNKRSGSEIKMQAGTRSLVHELMAAAAPECPAEELDPKIRSNIL